MIDNYQLWRSNEARLEAMLEESPICDKCRDYIQDDYYFDIGGEILSEHCLDKKYKKKTEDVEKCDYCGFVIEEDEHYDLGGEIVCYECLVENYRKNTENYER